MAQEHHMVPGKVAFPGVQLQACQLDPGKEFIQMMEVVCECMAVNVHIIQIYHTNGDDNQCRMQGQQLSSTTPSVSSSTR